MQVHEFLEPSAERNAEPPSKIRRMNHHESDEPKDLDSGVKAGQLDGSVTVDKVPKPVKPSNETPAPPPHVGGTPPAAPIEVEDDKAAEVSSKSLVPPNLHTTEAGLIKLKTICLADKHCSVDQSSISVTNIFSNIGSQPTGPSGSIGQPLQAIRRGAA